MAPMTLRSAACGAGVDAREPERTRPAAAAPVASAPSEMPTGIPSSGGIGSADLLDVIRECCVSLDPENAGFYRGMSPRTCAMRCASMPSCSSGSRLSAPLSP